MTSNVSYRKSKEKVLVQMREIQPDIPPFQRQLVTSPGPMDSGAKQNHLTTKSQTRSYSGDTAGGDAIFAASKGSHGSVSLFITF